jgi:hypothetical protein
VADLRTLPPFPLPLSSRPSSRSRSRTVQYLSLGQPSALRRAPFPMNEPSSGTIKGMQDLWDAISPAVEEVQHGNSTDFQECMKRFWPSWQDVFKASAYIDRTFQRVYKYELPFCHIEPSVLHLSTSSEICSPALAGLAGLGFHRRRLTALEACRHLSSARFSVPQNLSWM